MGCSNCEKCNLCKSSERKTHRTEEDKRDFIKRLNIIEGQIRGINQMIQNDRYCDDVLVQISAANKALKSLSNQILENHLKTCVAYDVQMGNLEILDDVMNLMKKIQ